MKLRPIFALLLVSVLAVFARAAAAEPADLGEGLSYLRVHSLGESNPALTAALADGRAWVFDLRRTTTSPEDAAAFAKSLALRPDKSPLFLLVSPDTPAPLAAALASLPRGALTLGVDSSQPKPVVVVAQTADADRRAYDAADSGTTLESLITGRIGKERYDEASLVREFEAGVHNPAPPPSPDVTNRPATEKAPAPTDRVLQRAVHLHRAQLALRPRSR